MQIVIGERYLTTLNDSCRGLQILLNAFLLFIAHIHRFKTSAAVLDRFFARSSLLIRYKSILQITARAPPKVFHPQVLMECVASSRSQNKDGRFCGVHCVSSSTTVTRTARQPPGENI
jgi:hypothetical protein